MQIVIDRDRQILYTRSQSGAIGVSCLHAAVFCSHAQYAFMTKDILGEFLIGEIGTICLTSGFLAHECNRS